MVKRFVTAATRQWVCHCFSGAGTGAWSSAPAAYQGQQVKALKVEVSVGVSHVDRDVEQFTLLRDLEACFPNQPTDFGNRSQEAIADVVHGQIAARYPGREITIEIEADGLLGVRSEYPAQAAP